LLSSCSVTKPIAATNQPVGYRVGEATQIGILFFPPIYGTSRGGIEQAARNGGITRISTVDYTVDWFLLFARYTTTVTGE